MFIHIIIDSRVFFFVEESAQTDVMIFSSNACKDIILRSNLVESGFMQ